MSEASAPSPETPGKPPTESAPSVRRVSKSRPKKSAKSAAKPKAGESTEPAKKAAPYPVFDNAPSAEQQPVVEEAAPASESEASPAGGSVSGDDWSESATAATEAPTPSEQPKRKRRRKKGKGTTGGQNASAPGDAELPPQGVSEGDPDTALNQGGQPKRPNQAPRVKVDQDLLAKFAWKIYLAEVSEEGVALVGDSDARELARRCFRLAELFLEEQGRRQSAS